MNIDGGKLSHYNLRQNFKQASIEAIEMRIVPWHTTKELQELKEWFYPSKFGYDTNLRARAVHRVKAYLTRGPYVPHSIDATSQLVQCSLFDSTDSPTDAVRLGYTLALIRFVNGMLDPTQQSQFAVPLHTLAELNGLPSWFVELRHSGTHDRDLPSLEMLRLACHEALEWLWDNYWNNDEVKPESDDNDRKLDVLIDKEASPDCSCKAHDSASEKLTELITSYKERKSSFKEYDHLWENNSSLPTSNFGDTSEDSRNFITCWLADFRETWKSLKGCPDVFIECIISNYDDTLMKISLAKLEWMDLELSRWVLSSYKQVVSGSHGTSLLKRKLVTSKNLLRLTKRIISGINTKQALHYWNRWYPIFENKESYLALLLLQSIEEKMHKALLDKRFRSKLDVEYIQSQLARLQQEMKNKGISASELQTFDNPPITKASSAVAAGAPRKRQAPDEVSELLSDLESLKNRAKRRQKAYKLWYKPQAWQPRPFGTL